MWCRVLIKLVYKFFDKFDDVSAPIIYSQKPKINKKKPIQRWKKRNKTQYINWEVANISIIKNTMNVSTTTQIGEQEWIKHDDRKKYHVQRYMLSMFHHKIT